MSQVRVVSVTYKQYSDNRRKMLKKRAYTRQKAELELNQAKRTKNSLNKEGSDYPEALQMVENWEQVVYTYYPDLSAVVD